VGPVPTRGLLHIVINSPLPDNAQLFIRNTLGQTVFNKTYALLSGQNVIDPAIWQKLPAGTYFLKIITNSRQLTKKVIKY
jgi:hypothetical protein